jgi:hypothetical protein
MFPIDADNTVTSSLMLTYRQVDDASLEYEPAPAAADVQVTMAASAELEQLISPPVGVPHASLVQVEYEDETEVPVSGTDGLATSQYSENTSASTSRLACRWMGLC